MCSILHPCLCGRCPFRRVGRRLVCCSACQLKQSLAWGRMRRRLGWVAPGAGLAEQRAIQQRACLHRECATANVITRDCSHSLTVCVSVSLSWGRSQPWLRGHVPAAMSCHGPPGRRRRLCMWVPQNNVQQRVKAQSSRWRGKRAAVAPPRCLPPARTPAGHQMLPHTPSSPRACRLLPASTPVHPQTRPIGHSQLLLLQSAACWEAAPSAAAAAASVSVTGPAAASSACLQQPSRAAQRQ
jgi:hypothetical protein